MQERNNKQLMNPSCGTSWVESDRENPLIQPTGSRNNSKWANNPREEGKEEHAPEPAERDCRHPSSDDSLSP